MKQFYGQMTRDELKGAVYSGEHLKEFVEMCEAAGLDSYEIIPSYPVSSVIIDCDLNRNMVYVLSHIAFEGNIQWQPEPDESLIQITKVFNEWPKSSGWEYSLRSMYYAFYQPGMPWEKENILLGKSGGKVYTKEQFEAAKVYVERKRKEVSPIGIAADIMGVCFDTFKVKEKENKSIPAIKDSDILNDAKPPIGIIPKSIWLSKRKDKLQAAINRYINAGLEPLPKWQEEVDWIDAMEHNDTDNQLLEIDQTVFNQHWAELTVCRIDDGKGVLCSDLQWYSADDLITDEMVIAVYQSLLEKNGIDREAAMDIALHVIDKFEIKLK